MFKLIFPYSSKCDALRPKEMSGVERGLSIECPARGGGAAMGLADPIRGIPETSRPSAFGPSG